MDIDIPVNACYNEINNKKEGKMRYLSGLGTGSACMIGGAVYSFFTGDWNCFHFSCLVAAVAVPVAIAATAFVEELSR